MDKIINKYFTIIFALILFLGCIFLSVSHYYLSLRVDTLQNKVEALETKQEMVVDKVVDEIFMLLSAMLTPPTGIQKMERDIQPM